MPPDPMPHYRTDALARKAFPHDTYYTFLDVMTVRIDQDGKPWMLLRENGGIYWCEADPS